MGKIRFQVILWILATIALGLLSRTTLALDYIPLGIGDLLYATLIYWMVLWLFPKQSPANVFTIAITICFIIEFAQLLTWSWLTELRETAIGQLVLGNDFRVSDLLFLSAGVAVGLLLDLWFVRKRLKN